jgi:hypothetical protein
MITARILLVSSLLAGFVLVLSAQSLSASAVCDVFANRPYGTVAGTGGRSGCTSRVQVKTDLKYNRAGLPDPVVAFRSGSVQNVTWTAIDNDCSGAHEYYVDTNSATDQYSTSTRRTISC